MIALYEITKDLELFKKHFKDTDNDIFEFMFIRNCTFRDASSRGYLDLVKYLVSLGADVSSYDDHALTWAAYNGHLSTVKVLVENGANVKARDNGLLRNVIYKGHTDIAKYLQSKGATLWLNTWFYS